MKKRFNIFIITTLSITFICLIFILSYLNQNKSNYFNFINFNFAQSNNDLKVISENSISLENITNLNFNLNIDNIKFLKNDENKIKIIEKCNRKLKENEKLNIKINNNSLDIYRENIDNITANSFGESFNRELIIYLPESYNKNLNINTYFSDIDFYLNLNLKDIKINLSNGNINFNNSIKCNTFILENSTGDFYINTLNSNNYGISLNTGSINVNNLYGGGYINTTSADINLNLYSLTKNSHIYSSNGDINLNINKDFKDLINASSDVGKIKNDFKINDKINSSNTLNIKSGSGDISINKNY